MSRKVIIIMVCASLVSFAGAFGVAWFTRPATQSPDSESGGQTAAAADSNQGQDLVESDTAALLTAGVGRIEKSLSEKELRNLIYEVRAKIEQYNRNLAALKAREERLQLSHDMMREDIEKLNGLRTELAATVVSLKQQRDKLLKSRLEIEKSEQANLRLIAATYDKMDPSSASKIVINMVQIQNGKIGASLTDAVKILHYMTERTKAKLLAELVGSEPKLAAVLSQKLKEVVEEQ